ncbi:uncharacterized protein LOC124637942 [Helicoverpa zea]|uniref:uncharacterized protein LOC124637942 n=1 Tax=Helicoverpa zea TaxID=7113 RepID=UPI001F579663|nr:uncharacterized protein LOC124637942 [Helicoverpa zea]
MHGSHAFLFTLASLVCSVNCFLSRESICIQYYATGESYDLNELPEQMFGVYFWPPNQRQRDSCENISFKKLSPQEATLKSNECSTLNIPANETVMKATYVNNSGKTVNLVYYGDQEVKKMYRACDKNIATYIFKKVNDSYVLGINCSAGGRGILYSKFLPSSAEVQAVANSIEIMNGREGSPDCRLNL